MVYFGAVADTTADPDVPEVTSCDPKPFDHPGI
jgi:hypothetical protein